MRQPLRHATAVLLALALGAVAAPAHAAPAACAADGPLTFHCGAVLVEDLAGIPGTPWLIAGGLGLGAPGRLQLLDARSGRVTPLYPHAAADGPAEAPFTQCPGPPDRGTLSLGGVALRAQRTAGALLYAVNDSARRAIEVFRVQPSASRPQLAWIGCVPLPADTNPNAVVPLPDGGLAVVSMDDGAPDRMARHEAGTPTGRLFEWQPRHGLRELAAPPLRGGNGIAASRDGRWLFVSAWAGGELWRIDRRGGEAPQRRALGFLPDNIKAAADGTLWIAGQRPPLQRIARCTGNPCPADWVVARVDPETLDVRIVLERAGTSAFNYATGAVAHGGVLYIPGRGMDRLARIPLARLRADHAPR